MNSFINMDSSLKKKIGWVATGVSLMLAATKVYNELTKFNVQDKVILITGGSRGLGLVLARQLAMKGAKLAICARTSDQLNSAKEELISMGADVIALHTDVTDPLQADKLITDVVQHFGRIDVLINNAGTLQLGPQDTMQVEDYEHAMNIHFYAPLYLIKSVLPKFHAQGGGRILNITSIGGKIAVPHLLPYSASKFALVGLSEGMHAELKKHNIMVTTVVPNLMQTGSPMNIDVKGNHEAEYAWFKLSDSLPGLSQEVETAARSIINALEYGESEAVLTLTARLATMLKGFAPGWVNLLLAATNRFLPDSTAHGHLVKKGFESESHLTRGTIGRISDRAAVRNNEL